MSKITFDISRLVPRFLYKDKNGYAISKAIEVAFKYVTASVEHGIAIIQDPEQMPEWRLDEMAGELGCLYDYSGTLESKRTWIANAIPLYSISGTPKAIYDFLEGVFDEIELEEYWQYGGEPFHFRVTVEGEWTPKTEAWAKNAIATAQNLRSVLDDLRIGCNVVLGISATGEIKERFRFPSAGELVAGEYPTENIMWEIDETPGVGLDVNAEAGKIAYRLAGTYPETAHGLVIDGTPIEAHEAEEVITPVYYPMCGEITCGEVE